MALVNHEKKFLYLMEPHMASRATVKAVTKFVPKTGEVGHHHIRLDQLTDWRRQHLDEKRVRDYKILCTVRNPFDTLVTRWRQGALKDTPLPEVVKTLQEDHPLLFPSRGMDRDATHIIMFEALESDLQWVFNNPAITLDYDPMHKTPGKEGWHTYYDDESFDTLYNRPDWQRYMNYYGYRIFRDGSFELDRNRRVELTPQIYG